MKSNAGDRTRNAAERKTAVAKSQIASTCSAFLNRSAHKPAIGDVNAPNPMASPHHNVQPSPPGSVRTYGSKGTSHTGNAMY